MTKSQATDTDLEAPKQVNSKPNTAQKNMKLDEEDRDENYEEFNHKDQDEFMAKSNVTGTFTMMRKTPITIQPSDAKKAQDTMSDEQRVDPSEQKFESAVDQMYNTAGPETFNNQMLGINQQDLDNIDPKVFQKDLEFEQKVIIADLCLNSNHSREQSERGNFQKSTARQGDSKKGIDDDESVMSHLMPLKV